MIQLSIVVAILVIAFSAALIVCNICKYNLKKEFEERLAIEQRYRYKLEELYSELYREYNEHMYKHH